MVKITKVEIQKNNKQKVNIYVDGEYYNKLYLDTCVKYSIKSGLEIDKEKFDSIIEESNKHLALNSTVKYISTALKTKKQIKDYLKKKDFDNMIIDFVIAKLEEYKYLDDTAYIQAYYNTNKSKFGINKIKINLKQKGISETDIEDFFINQEDESIEYNSCYNLAVKKSKNLNLSDVKNKQKLNRYLLSRGFDFELINKVVKNIELGEE